MKKSKKKHAKAFPSAWVKITLKDDGDGYVASTNCELGGYDHPRHLIAEAMLPLADNILSGDSCDCERCECARRIANGVKAFVEKEYTHGDASHEKMN